MFNVKKSMETPACHSASLYLQNGPRPNFALFSGFAERTCTVKADCSYEAGNLEMNLEEIYINIHVFFKMMFQFLMGFW